MGLIKLFNDLPDTRRLQGQRYKLNYVLVCSILSILSGARLTETYNGSLKFI